MSRGKLGVRGEDTKGRKGKTTKKKEKISGKDRE
jgi:hypothetical protein